MTWSRRPVRLACLLLAALGIGAACPAPGPAQGTASVGAVMGSVMSQNNVPLEGADVALEGFGSAYTDSMGRFIFSRVPPGNYRLNVHKQGFTAYNRAMSVRAGGTERLEVVLGGFADPPTITGGRASVPLMRVGNAFLVRALLNGRREVLFYVDTGASYTTISSTVAQDLGVFYGAGSPMVTIVTASDTIRVPVTKVESIQIGGVEARDVQVVVHDLPRLWHGQVVGLLGNSFLSRFHVQLDPVNNLMMLSQ